MGDRPPDDPTGRRQPPRQDDPAADGAPAGGVAPGRRSAQPGSSPSPSPGSAIVQRYGPGRSARPASAPAAPSPQTATPTPTPTSAPIRRAPAVAETGGGAPPLRPAADRGVEALPPRPAADSGGAPFGLRRGSPAPAARPAAARPPPDPLDPDAWADDLDDWLPSATDSRAWDGAAGAGEATPTARPRQRSTTATATRTRPGRPPLPSLRLPASFAGGDFATDRIALSLVAANLVGALLMAIVLTTASGGLPDLFVQHLDAAGIADRWGPPRTLWRLPLIAVGVTAMNTALAWFLARTDRFAGRFALAAALVVQLLTWIALFDYV